MVNLLDNAIKEVIDVIVTSFDYQNCIKIKEKMKENLELMSLISELKDMQKVYVKSNFDINIKNKLDILEEKLFNIPLYLNYINSLNKVNDMISYVQEDLNDYFNNLLN